VDRYAQPCLGRHPEVRAALEASLEGRHARAVSFEARKSAHPGSSPGQALRKTAIEHPLPNLIRNGATNDHDRDIQGMNLMTYIVAIAVIGILALQATGSIPAASVGGSLVIAMAFFLGAFVVAIHEAVVKRRGLLGWIVNIVVAFVAVFFTAQIAGIVVVAVLAPFMTGSSMAKTGGIVMSMGLALGMVVTLLGSWAALQLVNRWRDHRPTADRI
jgi:hypothetical protein